MTKHYNFVLKTNLLLLSKFVINGFVAVLYPYFTCAETAFTGSDILLALAIDKSDEENNEINVEDGASTNSKFTFVLPVSTRRAFQSSRARNYTEALISNIKSMPNQTPVTEPENIIGAQVWF